MDVFLVKITNRENVDKILDKREFTHLDIYLFGKEIKINDFVFFVFSGDKSKINWEQGLIGFGKISREPYDNGYHQANKRYFKIDIIPEFVLEHPLPPKFTKLHPKYQNELYDVPYVGANHFPNQAIAKTTGEGAETLFYLFKDLDPESVLNLDYEFLNTKFTNTLPKPFLLLAGISGTGKTRFVRVQAARSNGWDADDPRKPDNYELVAVRPDWHEPSDLLGYVSRINGEKYVPTSFLSFLIKAWQEVFARGGSLSTVGEGTRPFWLCLDEMNLAPVEQYFADYLSILESRRWTDNGYSSLPIISDGLELVMAALGGTEDDELWRAFMDNGGIPLPPNLIVAGTVNMDDTTHGFSRKVIDRALTLDFQEFFPNRFDEFFSPQTEPKLFGFSVASHVSSPGDLSVAAADSDGKKSIAFLDSINEKLKSTPFELAYRSLNELLLSVKCSRPEDDNVLVAVWDDFLMQKVLPRIEGDAETFGYTGEEKSGLLNGLKELINEKFAEHLYEAEGKLKRPDLLNQTIGGGDAPACSCKSLDKIAWMHDRLAQNQYTSFWA